MIEPAKKMIASFALSLVMVVALLLPASADGQRINKDADGLAIYGYDTVAYFTEGRPTKGVSEFEVVWDDSRWFFSSARHRDMFAGDPIAYAPQYGGFCAGGMALGVLASVDPKAWAIVDGLLYLNYAERYVDDFVEDAPNQTALADTNWERLGTD